MTRERLFLQYSRVYVWAIFVEFFFAGLGSFRATDDYHWHNMLGLGLLGGAVLMFLLALVWRFPGQLVRMSFQLGLLNGLMLFTGVINEDAPADADFERGFAAFHAVVAVGTYVLGSVIVKRAAAAFGLERPMTLYYFTSRLLKREGRESDAGEPRSGTGP